MEEIFNIYKRNFLYINREEKTIKEIINNKNNIIFERRNDNNELIACAIVNNEVDKNIQEIIDNKVRNRLVFGDKMPMQYFINYYGLEVSAAFNGCSTETEPSSKTIAYLVNKSKDEQIPVILYVELNTGKVAEIIANEIGNGCTAMQIQTLHNVSKTDFDNGETWVSLMNRNIDVLKKALQ